MAGTINYVKFQRGTQEAYARIKERNALDANTLYFIYNDPENEEAGGLLYLGERLIGGTGSGNVVTSLNDLSDVDLFNIIVDKIIRENGNNYQVNISGDKILQEIKDYFGEKVRFTNQTYDTCPKYEFNTATSTYEYRTSDCSRGNYDSYVLKRVVMGKQSSDDLKIYVRCLFVKNNNGALSFGTTAGNFGNLTDYERVGDSLALTNNNFIKGTLYEITYNIKDNRYVFDSINVSKG